MKWQTVAPIRPEYRDEGNYLNETFELGKGVSVGPYALWPVDPVLLDELSYSQRYELRNKTKLALVAEYEADSFGDPDPEWRGKNVRSKQATAQERIQLANLALWLALPSPLGFEIVVHQHESPEGFSRTQYEALWWVRPLEQYASKSLSRSHLEKARSLFLGLCEVPRDGGLWVAVRMLFKAIVDREGFVRLPLLWIAIEALFGPENMKDVKNTICRRASRFLEADASNVAEISDGVRTNYGWRSAVVHGLRLQKGEDKEEEGLQELLYAEFILRNSLVKILLTPEILEAIGGFNRESYLDGLALPP